MTKQRILRHYLILAAAEAAVMWLINYLMLPAWNVRSVGLWAYLAVGAAIPAIAEWSWYANTEERFILKVAKVFSAIFGIIILVMAVGGLTSSHLFNAEAYRDQIEIVDGDFARDVPAVENAEKEIPIVDKDSTRKLGDRTLGTMDKVSQFEVAYTYKLIMYQGQQYRIAPFEYGGFFKFMSNRDEGVPGYVLVNTVTQEAELVKCAEGMKYIPSAYWDHDLRRHLRNNFPYYIFGDEVFEIDEEGNGYYVVPVLEAQIGLFGGKDITSVILVNAATGECAEYAPGDLPEWVDVVYSADYVMRKVRNHYRYVHGFFNFSHADELKTSYEYRSGDDNFEGYIAMVSNGEVVYYTGVTSAGSDESNIGFLMISSRTGEVRFYSCPGAEEDSARHSAEGLVQNWGYTAGYPMILNVDGRETYFITLKDASGLVKKVALVNLRNYTKAFAGDTISETVAGYRRLFGDVPATPEVEERTVTGIISEIYTAQIGGDTYFYYRLGEAETLYRSSILVSDLQVTFAVGDTVDITYTADSADAPVAEVLNITRK